MVLGIGCALGGVLRMRVAENKLVMLVVVGRLDHLGLGAGCMPG